MSARKIVLFIALAAPAWGCSETEHSTARQGPPLNFVPTAAIVNNQPKDPFTPPPVSLAYNVLPASDTDFFIPRGEREAIGTTPLYEYSAYSVFTYDVQPVGIRHSGYGYRYRWLLESGVSAAAPGH